jgi:hypothetical protein
MQTLLAMVINIFIQTMFGRVISSFIIILLLFLGYCYFLNPNLLKVVMDNVGGLLGSSETLSTISEYSSSVTK